MAKITLNKDGTPRKKGSGRKAGSSSFIKLSRKKIAEVAGEDEEVVVSRKWYEAKVIEVMTQNSDLNLVDMTPEKSDNARAVEEKIAFKLT